MVTDDDSASTAPAATAEATTTDVSEANAAAADKDNKAVLPAPPTKPPLSAVAANGKIGRGRGADKRAPAAAAPMLAVEATEEAFPSLPSPRGTNSALFHSSPTAVAASPLAKPEAKSPMGVPEISPPDATTTKETEEETEVKRGGDRPVKAPPSSPSKEPLATTAAALVGIVGSAESSAVAVQDL